MRKNDMQEKVNPLVRLHEAMQEKLKTVSYSERIPDKWSQMYCSEYSISLIPCLNLTWNQKSR